MTSQHSLRYNCPRATLADLTFKQQLYNRVIHYSVNYLMNEIFLINDDFMPISSLRCFKDVSGMFKYFLSKYDYENNFFIKKTNVKDDYIYDDSKLIPFEDLVFILNLNPEKYNYQKECNDSNCFSEIAKIALEKR